jgi:hypothetical protein
VFFIHADQYHRLTHPDPDSDTGPDSDTVPDSDPDAALDPALFASDHQDAKTILFIFQTFFSYYF